MKKKITFSTKMVCKITLITCFLILVGSVNNNIFAKRYGKDYLDTLFFEGDTFGCVFSPKPLRKPLDGDLNADFMRWDTCVWKNIQIQHPLDGRMFQDNYVINDNYIKFESIFAKSKSQNPSVHDYDYDITECLNLNPEIDYTGYATCSMSGKEEGDYILFYFEHSKLLKVWKLEWEDFLDFLKWDKEQGGTMEGDLKKNNWYNWDK